MRAASFLILANMTAGRGQKPPLYTGRAMQISLVAWIVIFAYIALIPGIDFYYDRRTRRTHANFSLRAAHGSRTGS